MALGAIACGSPRSCGCTRTRNSDLIYSNLVTLRENNPPSSDFVRILVVPAGEAQMRGSLNATAANAMTTCGVIASCARRTLRQYTSEAAGPPVALVAPPVGPCEKSWQGRSGGRKA
ncbi:hypothetical protein MTO96_047423 [Rhipicephalus appendiculatus]